MYISQKYKENKFYIRRRSKLKTIKKSDITVKNNTSKINNYKKRISLNISNTDKNNISKVKFESKSKNKIIIKKSSSFKLDDIVLNNKRNNTINKKNKNNKIMKVKKSNNSNNINITFTIINKIFPNYTIFTFLNGKINSNKYSQLEGRKKLKLSNISKLFDWVHEVLYKYGCSNQTYFLTVNLVISVIIINKKIANKDLHLLGITAMFICTKYEEINTISLKNFSKNISYEKFTKAEIINYESEVLKLLDFKITNIVTEYETLLVASQILNYKKCISNSYNYNNFIKTLTFCCKIVHLDLTIFNKFGRSVIYANILYISYLKFVILNIEKIKFEKFRICQLFELNFDIFDRCNIEVNYLFNNFLYKFSDYHNILVEYKAINHILNEY